MRSVVLAAEAFWTDLPLEEDEGGLGALAFTSLIAESKLRARSLHPPPPARPPPTQRAPAPPRRPPPRARAQIVKSKKRAKPGAEPEEVLSYGRMPSHTDVGERMKLLIHS